jgi:hypothetical protein
MAGYRGVGFSGGGGARVNGGGAVRFRDAKGRYIRGIDGASIFDQIGPRLDIGPLVTRSAIITSLTHLESQVVDWMKENAPWQDVDTPHSYAGETRDGLDAEVQEDGTNFSLVVFHTVDWGIWLEVRWNGRYSILRPTIEEWGPRIMKELAVFQ